MSLNSSDTDSAANAQFGFSWLKKEKLTFIWTIKNYIETTKGYRADKQMKSPEFSSSKCTWYLETIPNRSSEYRKNYNQFFSLYLILKDTQSHRSSHVDFKLNILDPMDPTNSTVLHSGDCTNKFSVGQGYGYSHYVRKSALIAPENGYLGSDGSLKISVELTIKETMKRVVGTHHSLNSQNARLCRGSEAIPLPPNILETGELSDVKLIASDGQVFTCHTQILANKSTVFLAMFQSRGMIETEENLVVIEDIDGPILGKMLQYVYTGNVEIPTANSQIGFDLLMAANKYNILDLIYLCEKFVIKQITHNVWTLDPLELLRMVDSSDAIGKLRGFLIDHISKNQAVLKSDEFSTFAMNNTRLALEIFFKAHEE